MEKAGIRKLVTENTDAMLAYWDADQVCRYANNAYINWFGKSPEEMIDKITLRELLKDIYPKNLPYIEKVLQGKTQVFYRDIRVPTGETRRSVATYHPDIEHGVIKGFFVHVADMGTAPDAEQPFTTFSGEDILELDKSLNEDSKRMQDVAAYLKAEMFNGFPGLADIAKKFFISVSKLKRDFAAVYQTTPMAFYRNQQMHYASRYLQNTKVTKKELAAMLHFSNPSNFSNYFRKFIDDLGRQRQQHFIKKQSGELNRIFIEQSPFAIAMFDLNMDFLAASGKWISDYQLQNIDLAGRAISQLLPELSKAFQDAFSQALTGKISSSDEYFWKKANNLCSWIKYDIRSWHISQGEIGGILMFTEDITQAKEQELSSHRANYILKKTNAISKIGTWERNLITGTVTCNDMALEILEIDNTLNGSIAENLNIYKGESRKRMQDAINNSIHTGGHFDLVVEINVPKSGSKKIRVIGQTEFSSGIAATLYGLFMEI